MVELDVHEYWIVCIGSVLCMLLLVSCTAHEPDKDPYARTLQKKMKPQISGFHWQDNACGYLTVKRPQFNVSGRLTAATQQNTSICLLIARNTSLETGLWTADHCAPLMCVPIAKNGSFWFPYLPVGKYFALVHAGRFIDAQGFPVIKEFVKDNHTVRVIWHGGDYRYSMAAFVVEGAQS